MTGDTTAPTMCQHNNPLNACPFCVAWWGASTWMGQNPATRVTEHHDMIVAAINALLVRGMITTRPAPMPAVVLAMAEQHRPIRFDFVGNTYPSYHCQACGTNFTVVAPGDIPYRCAIWQQLMEEGIVTE